MNRDKFLAAIEGLEESAAWRSDQVTEYRQSVIDAFDELSNLEAPLARLVEEASYIKTEYGPGFFRPEDDATLEAALEAAREAMGEAVGPSVLVGGETLADRTNYRSQTEAEYRGLSDEEDDDGES